MPTSLAMPDSVRKGTGLFKWALVFAVVLGAWGVLFTGVSGALTAFDSKEEFIARSVKVTERGSGSMRGPISPTLEVRELQAEMVRKLAERLWKLHGWQRLTWAASTLLSVLLLAGAFLVFKRSENGRRLLRWTAFAHLPYEALAAFVSVAIAVNTREVTGEYMVKMMSALAGPRDSAFASGFGSGMVMASFAIGIAVSIGWRLFLVAFYVWLAVMLNRREARSNAFPRPGPDGGSRA